jgi:L-ascorbate metabolism protein UlaG (beta-lactamase superfamily)
MLMAETKTLMLPGAADSADLEEGSILFIGTATTLIRYGGFTILTDPNFLHAGDHVHLGYGLTSERLTNPALEIGALPPLDLCVLSHMHGDHWDRVAEEKLPKGLPIVTTSHAVAALKRQGFTNSHALDTWDTITITKGDAWLRITAMPGKHGPGLVQALLPSVMGSMLEWGMGTGDPVFRLYISGDTLLIDELREIPLRYPNIDLGLFHLGGTRIFGLLLTMDAKQGVQAVRIIQPQVAIPIHYNDYTVFKSPLEDFQKAVAEANLATEVHYLSHGETYTFAVAVEGQPGQHTAGRRNRAVSGIDAVTQQTTIRTASDSQG